MKFDTCFHPFFHFSPLFSRSWCLFDSHTAATKRQTRSLSLSRLASEFEDVFDDASCDALGMGEWCEAQHVAQGGADWAAVGPKATPPKK